VQVTCLTAGDIFYLKKETFWSASAKRVMSRLKGENKQVALGA
jgi:hypothetical protein